VDGLKVAVQAAEPEQSSADFMEGALHAFQAVNGHMAACSDAAASAATGGGGGASVAAAAQAQVEGLLTLEALLSPELLLRCTAEGFGCSDNIARALAAADPDPDPDPAGGDAAPALEAMPVGCWFAVHDSTPIDEFPSSDQTPYEKVIGLLNPVDYQLWAREHTGASASVGGAYDASESSTSPSTGGAEVGGADVCVWSESTRMLMWRTLSADIVSVIKGWHQLEHGPDQEEGADDSGRAAPLLDTSILRAYMDEHKRRQGSTAPGWLWPNLDMGKGGAKGGVSGAFFMDVAVGVPAGASDGGAARVTNGPYAVFHTRSDAEKVGSEGVEGAEGAEGAESAEAGPKFEWHVWRFRRRVDPRQACRWDAPWTIADMNDVCHDADRWEDAKGVMAASAAAIATARGQGYVVHHTLVAPGREGEGGGCVVEGEGAVEGEGTGNDGEWGGDGDGDGVTPPPPPPVSRRQVKG
jgi:hypothetical protein